VELLLLLLVLVALLVRLVLMVALVAQLHLILVHTQLQAVEEVKQQQLLQLAVRQEQALHITVA
jgi:hypothetical protein